MRNFYLLLVLLVSFATKSISQTVNLQGNYVYQSNMDYKLYVHPAFNRANSVGVMGLTIKDPGGDGLPTTLTAISFSISGLTGNSIAQAAMYNSVTNAKIDTFLVANGATTISFTHGTYPSAPNGDTVNIELRVTFKNAVIDNQQIQFTVSSVTASASGSQFASANGGGATSPVTGGINKLSVTADRYKFGQQPTNIYAGQIINPTVTVKAVDINSNVDSDFTGAIKLDITNSIPSCDTLAGNLVNAVSGIASFTNLIPNIAEFNVILTTIGPLTNVLSSPFDVNSAQIKALIFWNFTDNNAIADGGTNTNYLTKSVSTTSTGAIGFGNCGCIADKAPDAYTTGWDNGSGTKYWQIDFASLGYWNMTVACRQRSTPNGPRDFKVQYRLGTTGTWTNIASVPALEDSFKYTTLSIPEFDSSAQVYVRWMMNSNTSIAGGVVADTALSFIDDITVYGTAITLAKQLNYRTKSSGDWESSCNWETYDTTSATWVQAHGTPDFTAYQITVQTGHTIAINQSVRLDQVTVQSGATLVLNKGLIYISNGGGVSGLYVKGTYIDNSTGSTYGIGFGKGDSWKMDSAATIIRTGNSNPAPYRDYYLNGMSTIPAGANWIIRYNGIIAPTFTTDSTFYPNLTFESTSGNWTPGASALSYFNGTTAPGAFTTVKGNLDIGGTGSGTVKINNISPNSQPFLVQGNATIRTGNELTNILNASNGTGFEIKGNLTVAGTLTANGGSGVLKMSGSTPQTMSGAGTLNIKNFSVANTGGAVTPSYALTIPGTDSLIAGTLNMGVNTLTLNGPLVRTGGNINAQSNTTIFSSAVAQTIPANAFLANTISNLTIANNVTLAGQDSITGMLSLPGTSKVFTTNGYLTLKSTASGTANVGQIANGNSITGDVNVERYISAKRAWRFLSIPTNTVQTVKSAWQEGAITTGSIPVANYGTQVTDKSATWAANGFDYYSPDGPSVKQYSPTYNSTNDSWVGITSTTTPIKTTGGFMTFVRGDRRSTTVGSTPYATVLRTKGPLYTGAMASIPVPAKEFISIGNPYASALALSQISKPGVDDFFYVWDPYLANSNGTGFGAFQTIYKYNGSYYALLGGGSYPSGPVNYIESGQAFFVYSNAGGSVNFDETAKASANTNPLVFRSFSTPQQHLLTNLYAIETDGSNTLADAALEDYSDSYSNDVDQFDALKAANFSENLAIKNGATLLSIERRRSIILADTIQFNMTRMKAKSYKFEIIGSDFMQPGLTAFLEDSYFNTRTAIDPNGTTTFEFTVVNIPGSYNQTRFRIIFAAPLASPLPVTFSVVKASQQQKNIAVSWKIENEKNVSGYVVEKSVNGQQFNVAATVAAKNSSSASTYQWLDLNPSVNNNYYRIKSISANGEIQYSNIVKVFIGSAISQVEVFPNPVVNGVINLQLTNQPKGTYSLRLLNKFGQVMQVKQIEHTEGNSVEAIQMSKTIAHGTYQLEVTKPDNTQVNINLLY